MSATVLYTLSEGEYRGYNQGGFWAPDSLVFGTIHGDYENGDARLWEAESGTMLMRFRGHSSFVEGGCISADYSLLASGACDWNVILRASAALDPSTYVGQAYCFAHLLPTPLDHPEVTGLIPPPRRPDRSDRTAGSASRQRQRKCHLFARRVFHRFVRRGVGAADDLGRKERPSGRAVHAAPGGGFCCLGNLCNLCCLGSLARRAPAQVGSVLRRL